MIRVRQRRHLGVPAYHVTSAGPGLRHHFFNPRRGFQRHTAGLLRHLGRTGGSTSPHWSCCVTTAESRALRSASSGLAWGLEPFPASSSDCVINAEHIDQLSRFHAKKLSVLNFVRFDQALYFFGKKLFVKKFLVITLFVTHKFKYPVYLGASFL